MELALIPASRKSSRWNNDKHVGDGRELEDRLVQTYHKANSRPRSILFVDSKLRGLSPDHDTVSVSVVEEQEM